MLLRGMWAAAILVSAMMPARGMVQCALTAVPLQINSEGLAEPLGDILVNCSGGPSNGVLSGTIQVSSLQRVANFVDAANGNSGGVTLSQEVTGGYIPLPVSIRLLNNSVLIEGVNVQMSPQGTFGLKISGIRAEAGTPIRASLQFSGNEQLLVQSPQVTVAEAHTGLYASIEGVIASGRGPETPPYLDYSNMVASGAAEATVRVTEGHAAAFGPWNFTSSASNGTRILIRLSGIPEGGRVYAPDAIAGSSAAQPTSTRLTGGGVFGGMYNPVGDKSLLLSRVNGGQPDGSKGFAAFIAGSAPMALFGVGEIQADKGAAYVIYEVMDANSALIESAQIPLWIFLPLDRHTDRARVTATVHFAPLSETPGPVEGAAIPRFKQVAVAGDCDVLNDCAAAYWPHLQVTPPTDTALTLPSGGFTQTKYVVLRNVGGGILEWRAQIRYRSATGWLTSFTNSGVGNYSWRYDVIPKDMAPGHYEADLVFQMVNSPTGRTEERVVPVTLDVTNPLPPPVPVPSIRAIVSPATGWVTPVAPGALAVIQGANFGEQSSVTVGGKAARVVVMSAQELTVEVPMDAAIGRVNVLVANGERVSPAFPLEIASVAPGMLFAQNEDNVRNSSENPVLAGKALQIFFTGTRLASAPLTVKLHDLYFEVTPEAAAQTGVDVVSITVPDYFPTMYTAVLVCGKVAGAEMVCSYPRDVWIKSVEE